MATLVNRGNFADVIDRGDGTVVKAFRSNSHTHRKDVSRADEDLFTRGFFTAEANAYEDLQQKPELEVYVPRFLGRICPRTLALPHGCSATSYVEGCGLQLERVVGKDYKLSDLDEHVLRRVETVIEDMKSSIRMGNPWDASCFVPGARAEFTLIDFSTWDDWYDTYEILERDGRLSDSTRRRLGA